MSAEGWSRVLKEILQEKTRAADFERQNLINYLKARELQVTPTAEALYAQWAEELKTQINQQLLLYADRHPEVDALLPQSERIVDFLLGWPDYQADQATADVLATVEQAFHAVALQLRQFYGREAQEDEVPCW